MEGSINIPYSGVHLGQRHLSALGVSIEAAITKAVKNEKVIIVAAGEDDTASLLSDHLVKCGVPRVAILHGGIKILQTHAPSLFHPMFKKNDY